MIRLDRIGEKMTNVLPPEIMDATCQFVYYFNDGA
jgi:hypothetical protein